MGSQPSSVRIFEPVDVAKIDIEGAERQALRGIAKIDIKGAKRQALRGISRTVARG